MSKKPLGKDKFGVQKVMRVKDYFGDATGQFALNAMSALVGQLTYFYTCLLYTSDVYKRQDILSGAVNPSGKLPDTWAKDYFDIPSSKNFYDCVDKTRLTACLLYTS